MNDELRNRQKIRETTEHTGHANSVDHTTNNKEKKNSNKEKRKKQKKKNKKRKKRKKRKRKQEQPPCDGGGQAIKKPRRKDRRVPNKPNTKNNDIAESPKTPTATPRRRLQVVHIVNYITVENVDTGIHVRDTDCYFCGDPETGNCPSCNVFACIDCRIGEDNYCITCYHDEM